mgnify:CR=1 FL=1
MDNSCIVYVLDPVLAQFRAQLVPELSPDAIREIIECTAVDSIPFDSEHTLYFDDEGLRNGLSHYTMLDGFPDPLIGKLLLAASSARNKAPLIPIGEAAARFHSYRPVIDPVIRSDRISRNDVTSFISAVEGFTARIERYDLKIVEQKDSERL